MAVLVVECAGEKREIAVKGRVTVGRSRTCTIRVKDPNLSRRNTRVIFDGRQYVIQDLASRNGTYVNGELLQGPRPLKPGDKIKVGETLVLTFALSPGEAAPAPEPAALPTSKPVTPPHRLMPALAADGPGPAVRIFLNLVLLATFAAGLYGFRLLFVWALGQITTS